MAKPGASDPSKDGKGPSIGIFFPALRHLYGGERLIVETADLLAQTGPVTLYTTFAATAARPRRARLVTRGAHWRNHGLQHLADWALMPLLGLTSTRHDVFLGMTYQGALGAAIAARRHGVPWVYECTEPPRFLYDLKDLPTSRAGPGALARLMRALDRRTVQAASDIISISDWTAQQVTQVYGRTSHIVYPGIDTAPLVRLTRSEARASLGVPPDQRLYVSLSKLHPRKRIDHAIEIFRQREAQDPNARLAIVGDGPDRKRLQDLAAQQALPRITFEGFVSEDQRVAWLRAADFFLFTARDEPFGLAPLEAQSAGAEVLPSRPPYPIHTPTESVKNVREILLQTVRGDRP